MAFDGWIAPYLALDLTPWGYANLLFADTLISWYVLDTFVARRSIYHYLGFMEAPLSPLLRFWRRVLLLIAGIATVSALLYVKLGAGAAAKGPNLQDLAFWLGPSLAAFGWMYTAFEKEKSDRAAKTLSAIQEQFYNPHIRETIAQLRAFRIYCRDTYSDSLKSIIPLERMSLRLCDIPEAQRPAGHPARKFSDAMDEFLNALDLLAFGVRQGDLDFRAVEMILRQRVVKTAYTFSDYIWQETGARPIGGRKLEKSRYRSTTRTWEHYL